MPLNTVCFRWKPAGLDEQALNAANAELVDRVNADGTIYLTHTKLDDVFTIRLAVGQRATKRNMWSKPGRRCKDWPADRTTAALRIDGAMTEGRSGLGLCSRNPYLKDAFNELQLVAATGTVPMMPAVPVGKVSATWLPTMPPFSRASVGIMPARGLNMNGPGPLSGTGSMLMTAAKSPLSRSSTGPQWKAVKSWPGKGGPPPLQPASSRIEACGHVEGAGGVGHGAAAADIHDPAFVGPVGTEVRQVGQAGHGTGHGQEPDALVVVVGIDALSLGVARM